MSTHKARVIPINFKETFRSSFMSGMTKDEQKQIVKEALKEWLDEKLATFGALSLQVIMGAALAGLLYFFIKTDGWTK